MLNLNLFSAGRIFRESWCFKYLIDVLICVSQCLNMEQTTLVVFHTSNVCASAGHVSLAITAFPQLSCANAHLQVLPLLQLQHTLGIWAKAPRFVPFMLSQCQLNTLPAAGLCFLQYTPTTTASLYHPNMALCTSLPCAEVLSDISFPPNQRTYSCKARHSGLLTPLEVRLFPTGCSVILRLDLTPELFRNLNKSLCPGPTSENYIRILEEENEPGITIFFTGLLSDSNV